MKQNIVYKALSVTTLLLVLWSNLIACGKSDSNTQASSASTESNIDILNKAVTAGAPSNFHALVDRINQFVNENSSHNGIQPVDPWDVDKLASMMVAYRQGLVSEAPIMLCGHRSNLMRALLKKNGYEVRIINVLSSDFDDLRGHVFMSVKNPETGLWEISDPDYGIYYLGQNGRLSTEDILSLGYDDYVPCRGNECGWNIKSPEGWPVSTLKDLGYLGAGLIYSFRLGGYKELIINSDRFDLEKQFSTTNHQTLIDAYDDFVPTVRVL